MDIQWFPGHMKEAERFLKTSIANSDVVLEILDARLPLSSSNPLLDKLCGNTLRIRVLNKKDLADPDITRLWLNYFQSEIKCPAIALTGTNKADAWRVADFAARKIPKKKSRRTRVIIAGIPNTGKSSIINSLAGRKVAKTGNVPAITRQNQRTGLKNGMDIYDTPGILWPVLDDEKGAYRLAASGAISDTIIDYYDIACFAINFMIKKYPGLIEARYKIKNNCISECTELLEKIGRTRGCLRQGGRIDMQKASEIFIRELRSGLIGRISFEAPCDALKNIEVNEPSNCPKEQTNK